MRDKSYVLMRQALDDFGCLGCCLLGLSIFSTKHNVSLKCIWFSESGLAGCVWLAMLGVVWVAEKFWGVDWKGAKRLAFKHHTSRSWVIADKYSSHQVLPVWIGWVKYWRTSLSSREISNWWSPAFWLGRPVCGILTLGGLEVAVSAFDAPPLTSYRSSS